ncbi:MAG: hypothetical protein GXY67_10535 [Clostridiales bacterium]|nr:hypothetical protein [Clostridiales bacterium]
MKRFKDLWNTFCAEATFYAATYDGIKGKRRGYAMRRLLCREIATDTAANKGAQKEYSNQVVPEKVRQYAAVMSRKVKSGEWQPHPPQRSTRRMPNGKIRNIAKATFDDHIAHWALINTIKAALMRGMYAFCCGSLPGRGLKLVRQSIQKWIREPDVKYFVKLDIRKFYENINIDLLMRQLERVIADRPILNLIRRILDTSGPGMPVGFYISPWLANYHLQGLDHYIVQGLYKTRRGKRVSFVKHYVRYMDDMLLIGSSRRDLEKAVRAIIAYLRDELGLSVKETWEIKEIGELIVGSDGKRKCRAGTYPVDMGGYKFYKMRVK